MSDFARLLLAGLSEALGPILMLLIPVVIVVVMIGPRLVWPAVQSVTREISLAVLVCSDVASNLTQLSYSGQAGAPAYNVDRNWFLFGGVLLALALLVVWCLLPGLLGDLALVAVGLVTGMASTLAFAGVGDALLTWLGTTVALLAIIGVVRLITTRLRRRWLFAFFGAGLLVFIGWTAFQLR